MIDLQKQRELAAARMAASKARSQEIADNERLHRKIAELHREVEAVRAEIVRMKALAIFAATEAGKP